MRPKDLTKQSVDQLVDRMAEIGVAQDHAQLYLPLSRYKSLYKQMIGIEDELRARGPEARLALLRLYNHPNKQVQLIAAWATLAVAPEQARAVLTAIQKSGWLPQSLDAGMSIVNLDNGVYRPK